MKKQIPFNLYDTQKDLINAMTCPPSASIRDALLAIDKGALGVALITDPSTDSFLGLITDGDIRRALLNGKVLSSPVADISRPDPTVAYTSMSVADIRKLLNDKIKVIPVLDEQHRVVDFVVFDERVHLPVMEPILGENELHYVTDCIMSGWVSSAGKYIPQFEEMFSEYCGTKFGIATSNGTTALHLALLAANVKAGDEVIIPTLTFIATANAARYIGATPIFVDSEPITWNMDPLKVEAAITPRTKAIIPVHLYGHPVDMDPIMEIARKHNLIVIEDAAEAHGAQYKGKRVGGIGDIGIFSFYGNKVITTGEGGMVVTNNQEYAKKAKILRDHGMDPSHRYLHTYLGYNYRMTNIQAALGVGQMERIDDLVLARRRVADTYREFLSDIKGIELPPEEPWAYNIYWLFSILITDKFGKSRDEVMKLLAEQDIDSRTFFIPVHQQPIYNTGQNFPIAQDLSTRGINLPSAATLTRDSILRVSKVLRSMQNS